MSSFYGERDVIERLKNSMGTRRIAIRPSKWDQPSDGIASLVDPDQVVDDSRNEPKKLARIFKWVGQEINQESITLLVRFPEILGRLRKRRIAGKNLTVVILGRKCASGFVEDFSFRFEELKKKP